MIELPVFYGILTGAFGSGVVAGILLHYYTEHRPLRDSYEKLVHTMTHMKRQGFVPQFEIEHPRENDPSNGINES